MKTELAVALIAGGVALASAAGTVATALITSRHSNQNALAIKALEVDSDKLKSATARQREISKYSEPLLRASYDLQSRIYNILKQELISIYLVRGNKREKDYVVNNTVFLIAQFQCWSEEVRREIQYIDLGEAVKTRNLLAVQDNIYGLWGTDAQPSILRIFAGEQRAIGEALIQTDVKGSECMGYGAFLKNFPPGTNPLIDGVRADVMSLSTGIGPAVERLTNIQHALIELLAIIDPDYLRFPARKRSRA